MQTNNPLIVGVGIDWSDINRFADHQSFSNQFFKRFLTQKEKDHYLLLESDYSKTKYLATIWTQKEAIFKAINHIHPIPLHKISTITNDNQQTFYLNQDKKLLGLVSSSYLDNRSVISICICINIDQYDQDNLDHYWSILKLDNVLYQLR